MIEIADRRNELAGNLSLYQELHFIEKIDQLLEEGVLAPRRHVPHHRRADPRAVAVRAPGGLGPTSKLNRDPAFSPA